MITFTQGVLEEVDRLHQLEYKRLQPDINSIISITNIIDTRTFGSGGVINAHIYWQFLHDVLHNIEHGIWTTMPCFWTEFYRVSDTSDLTERQVAQETQQYQDHREHVLRQLNIAKSPIQEKELILRWLRNHNGFKDMLSVCHALANLHRITTTVPVIFDYFNAANSY